MKYNKKFFKIFFWGAYGDFSDCMNINNLEIFFLIAIFSKVISGEIWVSQAKMDFQ